MKHIEKIVIGMIAVLSVLIVIIATDFWLLWLPLAHSSEYPQKIAALFMAFTALVTLLVVYATFNATKQSNLRELTRRKDEIEKEKRNRKERSLNEIIEWAIDVGSPKYGLNIGVLTSGGISDNDKLLASSLNQAFHLDMLIQKGNYIAKIAPIFTKDLEKAVEEVRVALREHQKIIDGFMDGKIDAKTVGKHDFVLTQTANKVIEETAKIKAKDIG